MNSGFVFSSRSYRAMEGVNPRLIAVASLALQLSEVDFVVTEGLRSKERQRQLVASGASQTMNSYHLTGHALDVAAYLDGEIRWDFPLYDRIAEAWKEAARILRIDLTWGGDWTSFRDGPHFQIPR
jgi:peptidoglycan L-alanyl-D-glutamate endopeptidase CwlK